MMLRFCNVFRPFSHSSNLDVILNHGWNSKTKGIRRKENPFFLTRKGRVKEDISLFLLPGRVMPRDDFRHQRRDIDPRGFHLVDRARRDERGIRPGHEEHHVHPRPGMSLTASFIIASLSSMGKTLFLRGLTASRRMTRSKTSRLRRKTSMCPFVMGSNDPG